SAQLSGGPFSRMKQLVKHLVHENNTPGELGMAAGIGAFIGCTPLVGIQWLLALYAGTRMHLNRIATVAATNVSFGPLTALIALASVLLGKALTGNHDYVPLTLELSVLLPFLRNSLGHWILGSSIIGLFMAFAVGLGTLYGVRALRRTPTPPISLDDLPSLTPPHGVASADIHAALDESELAEKGAEAAA
ncbi:MAG: DUF2062 domain-containing protein, partial [Phycisphaerales bacterium]|nr:DUF2062 domain-containing protein [Phycisphaerales bacterium]